MSDWMVFLFVAILLGAIVSVAFSSDSESWVQTEDTRCVLRVNETRHLFSEDTTTRVRYCR